MDIVLLVLASIIGFFVTRLAWAFAAVAVVWAFAAWMAGWGPAHSAGVKPSSSGFFVPWLVLLVVALALTYGLHWLRVRRLRRTRVS